MLSLINCAATNGYCLFCVVLIRWNNRIGPAMLRRAGMTKYIAYNDREFVEKAVRLINNLDEWATMIDELKSLNLDELYFNKNSVNATSKYYPPILDYLIRNHDAIQASGPTPIIYLRNVTDVSKI